MLETVIPQSSYHVDLSVGSGDCLVMLFPFFQRLYERGIQPPLPFPATIVYEHHFPRNWYYFERDDGHHQGATGGVPQAINAVEARPQVTKPTTHHRQLTKPQNDEELTKQLLQSNALRQLMGLKQLKGDEKEVAVHHRTGLAPRRMLMRRTAKECDSESIRAAFAPAGGKKKAHHIGCAVVVRDSANGNTRMQHLDRDRLANFLLNTPEQCILTRAVPSRRRNHDVFIASWTPSVFSVEHRVNVHHSNDASVSSQERGDTITTSNFTEHQCCPLLASRIREAIQRLVWLVEKYEKRQVLELRVHLCQDTKMHLWLLWADMFRAVVPRVNRPVTSANIWTDEEKQGMEKGNFRKAFKKVRERERTEPTSYGAWPSFTDRNSGVTVELLLEVEDLLEETQKRAKEAGSSLNVSTMDAAAMRKVLASSEQQIRRRSSVAVAALEAPKALSPVASPSRGLGGSQSRRKVTLTRDCAPMVPLSMQPLSAESSLNATQTQSEAEATMNSEDTDRVVRAKVHFTEIAIPEMPAIPAGAAAPPVSPRNEEEHPLVERDDLHVFGGDFNNTANAIMLEFSPSRSTIRSNTASPAFPSSGIASTVTTPGRSPVRFRTSDGGHPLSSPVSSRGMRSDSVVSATDYTVPASVRQLKQRKIATREPGPSKVHLREIQRQRFNNIEGHTKDNYFNNVEGLVQRLRTGGDDQPRPQRRMGGLRRSTITKAENTPRTTFAAPELERLSDDEVRRINLVRGLDVQQRVDYNELHLRHSTFQPALDDIAYEIFSRSLRQRRKEVLTFDLPTHCPMPDIDKLQAIGFHPIDDVPEVAATTTDPLFCIGGEINMKRAFESLKVLVAECCEVIEADFLRNCNRSEVLGDDDLLEDDDSSVRGSRTISPAASNLASSLRSRVHSVTRSPSPIK